MISYATERKRLVTVYYPSGAQANVLQLCDSRQVIAGPNLTGNRKDPLPWSYTKHAWSGWQGFVTLRSGGVEIYTLRGAVAGNSTLPLESLPTDNTVYNTALSRLNEKLRGSLDLSIALGEAGKTKAMLNANKRFNDYVNRLPLKSGKGQVVKKVLRGAGNAWLEYQYGWKPLISDIYTAADELKKAARKRMNVRGSARLPVDSYKLSGATAYSCDVNAKVTGWYGVRISVNCYLPESQYEIDRWTSLNPVSIAWELTPFSFVVDWFIDVGSSLRNFETACLNQASFHSGYVSRLGAYNVVYTAFKNDATTTVVMNAKREYTVFNRTVLTGFPFPAVPKFEIKLGWQRLLTTAGLLAQRLPRIAAPKVRQPRNRPRRA